MNILLLSIVPPLRRIDVAATMMKLFLFFPLLVRWMKRDLDHFPRQVIQISLLERFIG